MRFSNEAKIQGAVAGAAMAFTVGLLALQSCSLFNPSKDQLMAYCVKDERVVAQAKVLGVTPEQLCEELLKPLPADGGAPAACTDGTCPMVKP